MSASFLRALASNLEGNHCRLLAISTDSVEAHRFRQHCQRPSILPFFVCFREFAGASLKELSIPLVEDKTGEISRAFGVFDLTTHTAVPTAFILDEEGELMASFTTSTQVIGWVKSDSGQRWGALQRRWRGWWPLAESATYLAPGRTNPRAPQ